MTRVLRDRVLAAVMAIGLASTAAAAEQKPCFGRWASSKCELGATRIGNVCARAARLVSPANRRRCEEFAREAYFSCIEFQEDFGRKPAEQEAALAGENAEFYFDRGRVRAKAGEYDAAIGDFKASLRLKPNNAAVYFYRGCAWGEKKEYLRGIRDLDRCLRIAPSIAEAYRVRGAYWLTLADADQALADFNAFVRFDGSGNAYLCRALAWIHQSEPARAESDLEQAARLRPQDATSYYMLGGVRLWMGNDQRAIEAYNEALKFSPKMAVAYADRAIAWQRQGKPDLAAADLARAAELEPGKMPKARPARGCTVRVIVKATGAANFNYRVSWKNPVVKKPNIYRSGPNYYPASSYGAAEAARFRGYYEGLDPLTRRRAHALNEAAWHWATSRYENLRDGVRAVEAGREACELTHWKDASCLDTLAAAYAQCGDFESADKFQTLALELWPAYLGGRSQGERRLARYRQRQPLEPQDTYQESYPSAAPNAPPPPAPAQNAAAQQPQQIILNPGGFKSALQLEKHFDAERFKPQIKHGLLASPPQENSATANYSGASVPANASGSASVSQTNQPGQTNQVKPAPISTCPRVIAPGLSQDDFETVEALTNQAWLRATSRYETARDGVQAVEAAREACELSQWRVSACVEALAAAYAECGDFESAEKYQTLALELAAEAPADERHAASRRLARYRSRQSIHQGE